MSLSVHPSDLRLMDKTWSLAPVRPVLASSESDQVSFQSPTRLQTLKDQVSHFRQNVPASSNLAETIFDTRVELKVATSRIAMHLSQEVRNRIFAEFDFLLDSESWDLDDKLPTSTSYNRFLKWLVYTSDSSWTSFGIDDEGNILVAWVRGATQRMTANFAERVRWTKTVSEDGEMQISAGTYTLNHFAHQSDAFLSDQ